MARSAGEPASVSTALLVAVASAVITAVAVPGCIVMAHRFGVIDRPGPLKPHEAPVPYLGGVAVFAGLVVGVSVGRPIVLVPLAAAMAIGSPTIASGFRRACDSQLNSEWGQSWL